MHEIMDKKLVKLIKRFNLFMFWLPSSGQFYTYMKPKGDRDSCFYWSSLEHVTTGEMAPPLIEKNQMLPNANSGNVYSN